MPTARLQLHEKAPQANLMKNYYLIAKGQPNG
jgi:hypothetical protein